MNNKGNLVRRFARIVRQDGVGSAFQSGYSFLSGRFLGRLPYYRKLSHKYHSSKYRGVDKYDVPIYPFRRRFVNPQEIRFRSDYSDHGYPEGKPKSRRYLIQNEMSNLGSVVDGDWDNTNSKFNDYPLYQALVERYKHGKDWKETDYIKRKIREAEEGGKVWHRCDSKDDIINRCGYIDNLYTNIKENGYKKQDELPPRESYPRELINEILVDIGRDGELLFVNGIHRLSIAKIQNLDVVPVTVLVRHKKWMRKINEGFKHSKLPDHPDVNEVPA